MSLSVETTYKVVNHSLEGNEWEYEVPSGVFGVTFRANGGDVTLATAHSGDTFTIADGNSLELVNRNIAHKSFYLNGTATLEILEEYGLAS